ncbi:MAG: hypothetical protein OHK0046_46040 [Anaerolineae bacterium]
MPTHTPFERYISGGVRFAGVGFYDEAGLFCGGVTALAAGESAGLLRWYGLKQVGLTIPTRERQTQTGDDESLGSLTFQPTDPVGITVQAGLNDLNMAAALQGVTSHDDGWMTMQPIYPSVEEIPPACFVINSTAKKRVFGQNSLKGWEVWVLSSCEFSVGGPDGINERALRSYDFGGVADQVYMLPWGQPLMDDFNAFGGAGILTTLPQWFWLHAYRGHASTLTVELDYVPISAAKIQIRSYTIATGVWDDLAVTTDWTLSGKEITFTASQAGKHNVIRYLHSGVVTAPA